MKINSLLRVAKTLLLLILLSPFTSFSQKIHTGADASAIYARAQLVRESIFSELPSYIAFKAGKELDIDQVFQWMKKNMQLSDAIEFSPIRTETDNIGFTHYRFQQTFAGEPIEGAEWILHTKNDKVLSMNGLIYNNLINSGGISISEQQALTQALQYVGAKQYKWELPGEEAHLKWESEDESATYFPTGELVYIANQYVYNKQNYRLAYRFNIYAHAPVSRADVYIDATTGKVLSVNSLLSNIDAPGTANTGYSGTRTIITDDTGSEFRLRETGRGNGIRTFNMNEGTNYGAATDFTDANNVWNNVNPQMDEFATDAHWGAEMTYDYFWNIHGRNSIDGAGFQLNSYIHYDNNYSNAFWDGNRMTYGDGNGSNPFTALDIAGHEIGHGLNTFTANLVYQDESGALNESFSDIFGTCIENYARPSNWNWFIGEDLGFTLRSMSNPNSAGDPDTYFGNNWAPLGGADNGGVHTNSSVQNYWYYLLTDGGSGTNDNSDAYNVTGIGFASSSAIAFRNLTVYLGVNSQFSDARFYAIVSAMDLFGACSPEVEATTDAWYAVGVGNPYNPTVIAEFSAPIVTACSAPFTVDFTNESNNASTFSWDFGDGNTSTQNNPSHTYLTPGTYNVQLYADGGTCGNDLIIYNALIDIDPSNPCIVTLPNNGAASVQTACIGTIYDSGGPTENYGADEDAQITISPTGAASVDLTFTFFDIEDGTSGTNCDYDFLEVYDGPTTGSPLIGTYCNNNLPPAISSTGSSITILFHSDPGLELAGFQIDWVCISSVLPPVTSFNADVTSTCTGEVNFTDLSTNGPTSWLWDFGDGNTSTDQNPTHTYTANGQYTVLLTATNGNGSDSDTQVNYIVVNAPVAPTGTDDNICENNTATLLASGTNTLNWYDAPTGGTFLGTGGSYTTPVLATTTSYYVEEEVPATAVYVGPVDNSFGGGGYFSGDQTLLFDCMTPFILRSVWVDANSTGNRTIELRDNVGTLLQTITVNVPAGQSRITLDFDVPIGNDFTLGTQVGSNPDMYRNNSGPSFPYTIGGLVSITNSSAGNQYYYHFYDWEVQEYSCLSARTLVTANVTPYADATIAAQSALCTGDAAINLTATDAGGLWSGTGITDVNNGTFNPATAGAGTYTITYAIAGACGDTDTESITVTATPDATITPTTTFCSADAATNLTAATGGGTWSGTGITDANNGTFDPSVAGAGTHTITYSISGTCSDSDTEVITVTATPDATITSTTTFCSGDAPITLTAVDGGGTWSGPGVSGTTFSPSLAGTGSHTITYTISGTCGSTDTETFVVGTGFDATITPTTAYCSGDAAFNLSAVDAGGTWTGTGITDANNGTFDPSVAGAGTFTITYTIAGTCGDTDTESITVNATPNATITTPTSYCTGDAPVTLTAIDGGGVWSGPGVSGTTFTPANAGAGTHTITYTISGTCSDSDTELITVSTSQDATISSQTAYCSADAAINLTAADLGGVWSGTGITDANNGTFDPAIAGAGTFTITYTIAGTCGDTDTESITVTSTLDATITAESDLCESASVINMTAASAGGTWSGSGITDAVNGVFDPSAVVCGSTQTITYSITGVCPSSDTEDILVVCDADATITPVTDFCDNDAIATLTAVDAGGTWGGSGMLGDLFNPAVAGAGTHTITYTISGMCGDADSYDITVNASPDASFTAPTTVCDYDGIQTLTSAVAGGTWSSSCGTCINATTGEFDPAAAGTGTWTIDYTITSGGCTSVESTSIDVDGCLSITESDLVEISLYPNPANGEITILTGSIQTGEITITDLLGKKILQVSFNDAQATIVLESILSSGSYFANVFTENGELIAVKKFVKK